jgi:hypothetical protein
MMAKKLHEVLGSQSQVFTQADKLRTDLVTTFEKKRHLFGEVLTVFRGDDENAVPSVENQSTLQTTVGQELKWIAEMIAKALDSEATIDVANTHARANVVLDNGVTLLENLPATQLLQLDKRLGELQQLVAHIPTLDPAKGFTLDPSRGAGIYQARPETKRRTRKEQVPLTLVAPTKEHPGQAVVISKDVEVGTITTQEWSGLITPATKADMLSRVEEVRRAVKQARARANDTVVDEVQVGKKVLDYLFLPVFGEK